MSIFSNYQSETNVAVFPRVHSIFYSLCRSGLLCRKEKGRQQFERQLAFTPSMLIQVDPTRQYAALLHV